VGVAQAIEMVSDIYYARLQLHDRMDRIAKSLILRAVLSAIGLTVGVYLTGNLLWGIAGVAAARFLVFAGYDVLQAAQGQAGSWDASALAALRPRWDAKVQGELLRCSFPLGIVAALVALHSSIPRLFIENSLGERELGIFAALAFLLGAGSMAVVSLGQSAFARLARLYAGGDLQGFLRLLGKLLVWGGALGVSGIVVAQLAGQEILAFLFRPEYAERAALLPWIMAAGTVGYMAQFLGFGMTAARFNHPQVGLFVFTNLVLAAVCYELVPRDGLQGAIFAMLIASIVQFTGSLIILAVRLRGRAGERISRPGQAEESQEASAL
jgi:O-antigen/teichoic acid export membrane protein